MRTYPLEGPPPHPGALISRVLMRNRRLGLEELAEATGIDATFLSRLTKGDERITPEIADRFRNRFGRVADTLVKVQFVHDFWKDYRRLPTVDEREERLHRGQPMQGM